MTPQLDNKSYQIAITKVIATVHNLSFMMAHMEPGEKIRQAREARKWSQRDLGAAVGVSQVAIKKIEAGETGQSKHLPRIAQVLDMNLADLVPELAAGNRQLIKTGHPVATGKFVRSRTFKFYVQEWREFMGVKVDDAAKAAGMDVDEYQAFEHYPINFGLIQIVALADEFGIRGDQFWFPPPKAKPTPVRQTPATKKQARR